MSDAFLQPGSSVAVPPQTRLLSLDCRWNAGTQTAFAERLAVAALPLVRGRVPSREHVVFDNQPLSPDGAVRLSVRADLVDFDLAAVPREVEQIDVVVYVRPRPNAPRRTLDQLDALSVGVRDALAGEDIARSVHLQDFLGAAPAATVAGLVRRPDAGWDVVVQARGHESGLDGAAAAAGMRL